MSPRRRNQNRLDCPTPQTSSIDIGLRYDMGNHRSRDVNDRLRPKNACNPNRPESGAAKRQSQKNADHDQIHRQYTGFEFVKAQRCMMGTGDARHDAENKGGRRDLFRPATPCNGIERAQDQKTHEDHLSGHHPLKQNMFRFVNKLATTIRPRDGERRRRSGGSRRL